MQKLLTRVAQANTLLCVGLDPVGSDEDVTRRLAQVVAETAPYAAAFKPNLACSYCAKWCAACPRASP